eukprot:15438613-Alexandrium_andersonii.AAC.1
MHFWLRLPPPRHLAGRSGVLRHICLSLSLAALAVASRRTVAATDSVEDQTLLCHDALVPGPSPQKRLRRAP